eukprot:m.11882 g.11882  ORF g.11882 m.11882 type:complete len:52 (+) comp23665_c0_seq2:218-373(+)
MTVTTPGFKTARTGTWLGRIPKFPLVAGNARMRRFLSMCPFWVTEWGAENS